MRRVIPSLSTAGSSSREAKATAVILRKTHPSGASELEIEET